MPQLAIAYRILARKIAEWNPALEWHHHTSACDYIRRGVHPLLMGG